MTRTVVPSPGHISRDILVLRGHRVLLDAHLAALYGVTTKRLNEQVKRNAERFPEDFMFRLTRLEVEALNRSQIATGSQKQRAWALLWIFALSWMFRLALERIYPTRQGSFEFFAVLNLVDPSGGGAQ